MGFRDFFNGRVPRALLGINSFVILASSIVLTGILSYLVHWHYRGTHVIYQEVIAVVTLFIFLVAVFLPVVKAYHGYMLPLTLVLSYLWLTSLIFSALDYSGSRCQPYHCRLKHTVEAFQIIGFVFLFFNTILEALVWGSHGNDGPRRGDLEKAPAIVTETVGTTPAAADGERAVQPVV
ncbi:hypothetical protein C8A05DRAFT_44614 [Staphylotrichum tortipilum]|uniref:MARVEL domain-containing protein n=1 Tax=Staphylotrichum tortipilum TaxID=2831512 RepID=A0AAN6RSY0_9PEZI|nr:hypothetical protein C8A05DRAFT_44614 [Staphylotrichum longicolle]